MGRRALLTSLTAALAAPCPALAEEQIAVRAAPMFLTTTMLSNVGEQVTVSLRVHGLRLEADCRADHPRAEELRIAAAEMQREAGLPVELSFAA